MNTSKNNKWMNSMFSQLAHIENNSSKRQISKGHLPKRTKRISRRNSNEEVQETEEIIDLETCQDPVAKMQTSTFLKDVAVANTEVDISTNNWIDFFAPKSSDELAIHPKKLEEIKNFFQHCSVMKFKNPAQLCLLTGPSGCGKTAAVRIVAKENKLNLQEWINPVDQEIIYNLGDQAYGQSFVNSQLDAFKNFLFKASRYRSLLETNTSSKCVLIVKDFPNFLLRDPTLFQEILEEYVNYAKSPLIFIATDIKNRNLNISYNIFTDQIRQKFLITHISFNAIASTIMQKSLKRLCSLIRSPLHCHIYQLPSADVVDSIVLSAQGDIRNALINLHFCSLRGAPNLLTKCFETKGAKKITRKRKCEYKLKSLGRDESVTMMHALGRVFHPKFTELNRFVHSPEELVEAFTTEPRKFIDLVHANYISHFQDIEHLVEASDGLSICDIMHNEYRDDSLALNGLNIGMRSVMLANRNPSTGWMPIKGQKHIDPFKSKMQHLSCKILPKKYNISSNLYALDYKSYINVISH